jgi:hypothetical protein
LIAALTLWWSSPGRFHDHHRAESAITGTKVPAVLTPSTRGDDGSVPERCHRRLGWPATFAAGDALGLGTTGGAACLGRAGTLGVLTPGSRRGPGVLSLEWPAFAGALTEPVEAWSQGVA